MLWVLIRIAQRGDSNEYPQHMFLWRNKQTYPLIITKYPPYLFPGSAEMSTPKMSIPEMSTVPKCLLCQNVYCAKMPIPKMSIFTLTSDK